MRLDGENEIRVRVVRFTYVNVFRHRLGIPMNLRPSKEHTLRVPAGLKGVRAEVTNGHKAIRHMPDLPNSKVVATRKLSINLNICVLLGWKCSDWSTDS